MKQKLASPRAAPKPKAREFKPVPAVACWGLENCKELFGLGSDKESFAAEFELDSSKTIFFSRSRLVSRTLERWEALLKKASVLIESRAQSSSSVAQSS